MVSAPYTSESHLPRHSTQQDVYQLLGKAGPHLKQDSRVDGSSVGCLRSQRIHHANGKVVIIRWLHFSTIL